MARTPKPVTIDPATGKPAEKVVRKQNRILYLILAPGTDVGALRGNITEVTFNGRKLLEALGNGESVNFLRFKLTPDDKATVE